jgi:peptidoglycan/LPS O-acetylase OafA/YrhL
MPALTGIRGLAAVWVLLFHLPITSGLPLVRNGYLGVDLFFVLSGFVLSLAYEHAALLSPGGYLRFLWTRFTRVWPLHAAALLTLAVLVLTLPGFADRYRPDFFAWSDLPAHLTLSYLWSGHRAGWHGPSWSLSAEAFAYLLFPFVLAAVTRFVRTPRFALLGVSFGLCALVGFFGAIGFDKLDRAGLWLFRLAPEFLAGCLLYRAYALDGLRAFAASAPIAAINRLLSWRPVFLLGEMSFSLYMTHWTVIQVANWSAARYGWTDAPVTAAVLCAVGALTMGAHFGIERPAREWGRRIARPNTFSSPAHAKLRVNVTV